MIVEFSIPGVPQPQGSKRSLGRFGMKEANENLGPWREVALSRAREAREAALPAVRSVDMPPTFSTAVEVQAACYFAYRAGDYGTGRNAGQLKLGAPVYVATKPDLDKLLRAIGDILTQSQIVRDDSLIVAWQAVKKYGDPRIDLLIQPMNTDERFA